MATQMVNNDTNSRFHSFGKGAEHVVSLVASLSSAPYLMFQMPSKPCCLKEIIHTSPRSKFEVL